MSARKIAVLNVEERNAFGTSVSRRARREGKIPAVMYGHGRQSKAFLLQEKEWNTLVQHGNIHLVELKSAAGSSMNAIVKEVQHDYLKGATVHIDFLEVKMDEMITTTVAVHGRGTPAGLVQGGVLEQVIHDLEIKCLPKDIPEYIEVDISGIELGKGIHVKEIALPQGVVAATPADQIVFHVIELRIEEEAVAPAEGVVAAEGTEAAAQEPEIVGAKGKKLEEGEEEAAAEAPGKEKAPKEREKEKEKKK